MEVRGTGGPTLWKNRTVGLTLKDRIKQTMEGVCHTQSKSIILGSVGGATSAQLMYAWQYVSTMYIGVMNNTAKAESKEGKLTKS